MTWAEIGNWDAAPDYPPPSRLPPELSDEEVRAQTERWPPVRSPTLSRWAGLGYGQMQIGENFLLMAQYDKPAAMAHVLSPMKPRRLQRAATAIAGIAPFVLLAQLAASAGSSVPMSELGVAVVIIAFICSVCCGTVACVPDPGISPNFRMLDDEKTALHICAENGCHDAAHLLVSMGAALELRDIYGRTALHYAAAAGQERVVHFLLSHGADRAACDCDGYATS